MQGIEEETFQPRYNGYLCTQCKKRYLSVDLAAGRTPAMTSCLRTQGCPGPAISMGYQGGIGMGVPLLVEWVKPDEEAFGKAKTVMPQLYGYFRAGGLMRRVVDTAPDWVKQLA